MIEGEADALPSLPPTTAEERRLQALAAAVRDHESCGRHKAIPARPEDLALYRRLRQICGER